MCGLKRICRNGKLALLTVAGWSAVHATAFAQDTTGTEGSGTYVPSYAIVLLCVGLGMLLICRSSHRRERARPEQFENLQAKLPD